MQSAKLVSEFPSGEAILEDKKGREHQPCIENEKANPESL